MGRAKGSHLCFPKATYGGVALSGHAAGHEGLLHACGGGEVPGGGEVTEFGCLADTPLRAHSQVTDSGHISRYMDSAGINYGDEEMHARRRS